VIPWYVEHGAVVLEDVLDVDVLSPVREDWLTGGRSLPSRLMKGASLFTIGIPDELSSIFFFLKPLRC